MDPVERHLTGYLYACANGTVYDEEQVLVPNTYWFEPPLIQTFVVNDCLTHAYNYLCRHPVLTMRE